TLHAAADCGAGDALVLAQPHDGGVQRTAVPLVGGVDEHGHHLGVHFDFHGKRPYFFGNTRATRNTPSNTPRKPARTLPQTLASAGSQSRSRTSLNVSHSNVEKVV